MLQTAVISDQHARALRGLMARCGAEVGGCIGKLRRGVIWTCPRPVSSITPYLGNLPRYLQYFQVM